MSDTDPAPNGRVPTLVQLCQRVAATSLDSITTLGDLSYPLVKPLLERCSVEQLLKIEEASPHLQDDTLEIWMESCIRKYPSAVEKYLDDDSLEPRSWRERYMALKHEEEQRFERLGSKLKAQRMEAEERKKEREVKITDSVPPPKRPRTGGWGAPTQPKTLLQKTLSEASKIQKAVYTSRMIPPMNGGKSYRVIPKPSWPVMSAPDSAVSNRVSVNVVHKRPCSTNNSSTIPPFPPSSSSSSSSSSSRQPLNSSFQSPQASSKPGLSRTTMPTTPPKLSGSLRANNSLTTHLISVPADTHPAKQATPLKKDPMSSLFVPKHRAYSQRPVSQRPS